MNKFLVKYAFASLGFLGLSCINSTASHGQEKKPNIIIIVADDLGYGDLSCFGQQKFTTPNIDELAKKGIKFNYSYTGSSVCAPSRSALLTGLHTGHNDVRGNQPMPQLLSDSTETVAKLLKRQGYSTGIIGKWGIGHPPPVDDPKRKGFDYAYGYVNMWHAHNFFPDFLYENAVRKNIKGNVLKDKPEFNSYVEINKPLPEGAGEALAKEKYAPHLTEEKALQFISKNKNNPFFLMYTTTLPHANNEIKSNGSEVPNIKTNKNYQPDYGKFKDKNWPDAEKGFAEMVNQLDLSVGKIMAHLKKEGVSENTLVIFVSDNGPHAEAGHSEKFFNSSGGLRGMKRDLYEGGIRVPFLAVWPGKIKEGSVSNTRIAFWDYLPTLADISGVKPISGIDGHSFLPALLGKPQAQTNEIYYWEFYEAGGRQALLKWPYKAVKYNTQTYSKNGTFQLYDISKDPSESNDLAKQYPEICKQLQELMNREHQPKEGMSLTIPKASLEGKF